MSFRRTLFSAAITCGVGGVTIVVPALAQAGPSTTMEELSSPNWKVRAAAFDSISKTSGAWRSAATSPMLLVLLQRENDVIVKVLRGSGSKLAAGDVYGEGYAEYASEVLDACIRSCDRERLLSELFKEAQAGSPTRSSTLDLLGTLYERGSLSPADMARTVPVLLSGVSDSTSFMIRSSALAALGSVIRDGKGVSSADRQRIHQAALTALADPIAAVRVTAIHRIQEIGDKSDVALLTRISNDDTARTLSRGQVSFPVREAARIAIAGITGGPKK